MVDGCRCDALQWSSDEIFQIDTEETADRMLHQAIVKNATIESFIQDRRQRGRDPPWLKKVYTFHRPIELCDGVSVGSDRPRKPLNQRPDDLGVSSAEGLFSSAGYDRFDFDIRSYGCRGVDICSLSIPAVAF